MSRVTSAALASGGVHGGHGDSGGHGVAKPAADAADVSAESADGTRAVKLGEFSVRDYHSVSSRKDTVTFVLQARVKEDDIAAFKKHFAQCKNKIRDEVIVVTRLVPIEEYDDPELKRFCRRILLRLRRAIPELPLDDVYLSDFTLAVQSS